MNEGQCGNQIKKQKRDLKNLRENRQERREKEEEEEKKRKLEGKQKGIEEISLKARFRLLNV